MRAYPKIKKKSIALTAEIIDNIIFSAKSS